MVCYKKIIVKSKKMERLKIYPKNLKKIVKKVAKIIREGGIIISPTDTVYGLIADAQNKKAVKKIFKIKKRKEEKPIPIFVKDLKMAKNLAYLDKSQEKFLKKVWLGKVTVVLKAKSKKIAKGLLGKDKKIGLRIPNYKLLNILLEKLNHPLTSTSANISGKPASTKLEEVLKQFENQPPTTFGGGQPDLILDAGNLESSLPSTVIDLTNFKILREGELSKRKIFEILKKII